jgi:hypothetical protein
MGLGAGIIFESLFFRKFGGGGIFLSNGGNIGAVTRI